MIRYALYLAIKKSPTSNEIIDRFVVGMAQSDTRSLAQYWEHIRRYMEEDGPPLQYGEWRDVTQDSFSHAEAWSIPFAFLSKEPTTRKSIPLNVVLIALMPLTFWMGLFRWLAEITCRQPFWTPEILAAAGGTPFSDDALRALIPLKPEEDESSLDEDERAERAYGKQQATKPKLSPEMKKTGLVILGILVAMALVKFVQMQVRGY